MSDENNGSNTKIIVIAAAVAAFFVFIMTTLTVVLVMASAAAPLLKVAKVAGWFKGKLEGTASKIGSILDWVDPDGEDKTLEEIIAEELDCSAAGTAARRAGYCVEPVYAEEQSPVPPDKLWLVPIWQAAAKKYDLPWQLLAAVNAARTDFGNRDCPATESYTGSGFMRFTDERWKTYKNAGDAVGHALVKDAPELGEGCASASEPVDMKEDNNTFIYDPVDSINAYAKALSKLGATPMGWEATRDTEWAGAGNCQPSALDGFVYRYEIDAMGGDAGFNQNVNISERVKQLALTYTYATWGKPAFPTFAGSIPGENTQTPIPATAVDEIITDVGAALGLKPVFIERIRPGLHRTIQAESSYRPAITQGNIGDVNDRYPLKARGLFQMIPSKFWNYRVPGYDNVYNPLHNVLAAMNLMRLTNWGYYTARPAAAGSMYWTGRSWKAQAVFGGGGVWPGGGGWSPQPGPNPYLGKNPGNITVRDTKKPVVIKLQTDPTSKALRLMGGAKASNQYSGCYVEVIHDWYEAIAANPPLQGGAFGRLGSAIVIAKQEMAKNIYETPDGCNCGGPNGEIDAYLLSVGINPSAPAGAKPWCASFVSWVYQSARVQPITLGQVNGGRGSAAVQHFMDFARAKGVLRSNRWAAQPGDIVLFGDGNDHLGIVIGRTSTQITSIEGNSSNAVSQNVHNRSVPYIWGYVDMNALYGDKQINDEDGTVGDTTGGTTGTGRGIR